MTYLFSTKLVSSIPCRPIMRVLAEEIAAQKVEKAVMN